RLHRLPRGALPVAVHLRMLEEVARADHRLEPRGVDEVIVLTIALARPRRARRERHRQADVAVALQACVDDARLPGAGRGRDDEEGASEAGIGDWGFGIRQGRFPAVGNWRAIVPLRLFRPYNSRRLVIPNPGLQRTNVRSSRIPTLTQYSTP